MDPSPQQPTDSETLWVAMSVVRNTVLGVGGGAKGVAEICRVIGITEADLDDANMRLNVEQTCAGIAAALRISGDPELGLHLGERTHISTLGLAGLIMESSRDALAMMYSVQEFSRAFTRLQHFAIEHHGAEVHFRCDPVAVLTERSPETARFIVDTTYASSMRQLTLLTRKSIRPIDVRYRLPRPESVREHERIFGCSPRFDQPDDRMVFAAADLEAPIIGYNKELHEMLKGIYVTEMRKRSMGNTFKARVEELILRHIQVTFPTLEQIAEAVRMTPRTVQRKLLEEGTSYRALTDALKAEVARNLLANPGLSISDIAYKLGYLEATSFQRAFKQWTGTSPAEYRKQQGEGK